MKCQGREEYKFGHELVKGSVQTCTTRGVVNIYVVPRRGKSLCTRLWSIPCDLIFKVYKLKMHERNNPATISLFFFLKF